MSSALLDWKSDVSQTTPGEAVRPRLWIRWLVFSSAAVLGTSIDLLTKQWVFQWRGLPGQLPPWWLVEPYVGIETAVNPGALFGLGAGWGSLFAALSVLAGVAIVVWLHKFRAIDSWWLVIALACVMGGILGNLYDRLGLWNPPPEMPLWSSGVRDWILFQYNANYVWPNFNIADSLLVCGAIMLAVHSFWMAPQPEHQPDAQAIKKAP